MDHLFSRFAAAIKTVDLSTIDRQSLIPPAFTLHREGALEARYTPFETVNTSARVVVVGLTPGFTQWRNAVAEAQAQLQKGASAEQALTEAKRTGGFSGALRPNLVALLDSIGLHQWLQVGSCATLFSTNAGLLHSTSLLRHAVSKDGVNYSGSPDPTRSPFLRKQIELYFAREARLLSGAVFVPLGPSVSAGLRWLVAEGMLHADQIMEGLPHPSGANAERIAYFLGRKAAHDLSSKTNPLVLDRARTGLRGQVAKLQQLA